MKADKQTIESAQATVAKLTREAETLASKENFTPLNMLGLLCTMAVYWAKEHGIHPNEYARISNELLEALTKEPVE